MKNKIINKAKELKEEYGDEILVCGIIAATGFSMFQLGKVTGQADAIGKVFEASIEAAKKES